MQKIVFLVLIALAAGAVGYGQTLPSNSNYSNAVTITNVITNYYVNESKLFERSQDNLDKTIATLDTVGTWVGILVGVFSVILVLVGGAIAFLGFDQLKKIQEKVDKLNSIVLHMSETDSNFTRLLEKREEENIAFLEKAKSSVQNDMVTIRLSDLEKAISNSLTNIELRKIINPFRDPSFKIFNEDAEK